MLQLAGNRIFLSEDLKMAKPVGFRLRASGSLKL